VAEARLPPWEELELNSAIESASHEPMDLEKLRLGISQANIPTLLMVLVQLTGDLKWLEEPFVPRRGRGVDDNDSANLPEEVQQEIRSAACDAIFGWARGVPPALPRPDRALLARMLSVAMAEEVPEQYGDVIAAAMKLEHEPPKARAPAETQAIIIGAGISGICAAIKLHEMGVECRIFEKNSDFGGTWWENRYPGCGVDTPNLTYTFSFAASDWSRYFPLQQEILSYLLKTANRYELGKKVAFETTVKQARWHEKDAKWEVRVTDAQGKEQSHFSDIVISATGVLNIPSVPKIRGLESFDGPVVHTSRWPADLDVAGKRVAVVGNGASAMQVVPAIAPKVSQLTLFARSKQWAAPFPQFGKQVPDAVRYLINGVPLYRMWYEQRLSWTFNDRVHGTLFKDPEWHDPKRSVNAVNDGHRRFFTNYVISELGDRQDLLEHVLPDYPPFAKRMLLDNGWYRTLTRDNVRLIAHNLSEVQGHELTAGNGETVEVDVIILATGFKASELLSSYEVVGRNGRILKDFWEGDNASAYLGTTIPGFPNFFILLGPNVGSGHGGSMIRNIECQANYALSVLQKMFEKQASTAEVREDIYEDYKRRIDDAHEKMVWTHPGVDSWYRNSRGRVVAITPWRNDAFWRMTRQANPDDYVFSTRIDTAAPPT
jgi:4-hydroxyacetophenone monooxygenase